MEQKYKISKEQSDELYRTIKFINDTFLKFNISYWITGGTLLGAVRHSGLIPHDDDGDICVMNYDVPKIKNLVNYFKKKGYLLETVESGEKKICKTNIDSCDWFIAPLKGGPGVDVFVMYENKDRITYANPYWEKASNGGISCYFLKKYVFPLVPMHFGNFFVYVPNNPVEHLNRCYGDDWNSKSSVYFVHATGKWINSKPSKIPPEGFETIPPPLDTCEKETKVVCPFVYKYDEPIYPSFKPSRSTKPSVLKKSTYYSQPFKSRSKKTSSYRLKSTYFQSLKQMKLIELKAYAKSIGLKGYSKLNKEPLLKFILSHDKI